MALTLLELGARIAEVRRAAGMTQEELAKRLEIDRSAMAKIEKGTRKVDSLELISIAEATGRSVKSLLEVEQPLALLLRSGEEQSNSRTRTELKWAEKFMTNYSFLKKITSDE